MSLPGIIAAESPVVWWPLDDTSGTTAADASGGGHPGTYSGSPLPTLDQDGPAACRNRTSRAAQFDRAGSDQEYVHGASAGVLSGSGEFSMAIWYRPDAAPDYGMLILQRDWTQSGPTFDVEGLLQLEVRNGNAINVFISNGTASPTGNTYGLTAQQQELNCWHFAVVRRTAAGVIDVVVDGESVGSFTETHALVAASLDVGADGFDIGRGVSSSLEWERFSGRLAHAQLYSHRISDAFIAQQWRAGCHCHAGWNAGLNVTPNRSGWIVST